MRGLNAIAIALMLSMVSGSRPSQKTEAAVAEQKSVLSETVESFRVENSTMEAALRTLRKANFTRILIGFEKTARPPGQKIEPLSLSVSNTTIGEILDRLCRQSGDYTYEIVDGKIIHVHPARAQSDPAGLLDLKIADFSVQGNMLPAGMIVRIPDLAPELGSYLSAKKSEFYSRRGIRPAFPGAMGYGNMDPRVNLELRNTTVREILDGIVLYSVTLRNQTPADAHGYKLPTASWMYEFIVDPNAPTGLGGTPHWIAF